MATPITWRNVGTTASASGVGSLLESARRSAEGGFSAVRDVLDKAEATQDANREVIKGNNTADFLRQLQSYGSAEEYQNALQSGALDEQLDGYGRMIDPRVAEQMFKQGDAYRARDTSRNKFADETTLRGQRGLEDEIQTAIANQDFAKARELQGGLQMNAGEFSQAIREGEINEQKFGMDQGRYRLAQAAGARANQSHQVSMRAAARAEDLYLKTQGMQKTVADLNSGYQELVGNYQQTSQRVAQEMGLGADVTKMSVDDQKRLAGELSRRGIETPPTLTEFMSTGVSAAAEQFNFTPEQVVQTLQQTDALYQAQNTPLTADKERLESTRAGSAALVEHKMKENPFYTPASTDRKKNREITNDLISELYEPDTLLWKDQGDVRQLGDEWTTLGVPLGDTRVPIDEATFREIVRQAGEDNDGDMLQIAQEMLENPRILELMAEAKELDTQAAGVQANYQRGVSDAVGGTRKAQNTVDALRRY